MCNNVYMYTYMYMHALRSLPGSLVTHITLLCMQNTSSIHYATSFFPSSMPMSITTRLEIFLCIPSMKPVTWMKHVIFAIRFVVECVFANGCGLRTKEVLQVLMNDGKNMWRASLDFGKLKRKHGNYLRGNSKTLK